MISAEKILLRPCVTEKNTFLMEKLNQYAFEIMPSANKIVVREAVEKLFKVKVKEVRTMVVRGKVKRLGRSLGQRRTWKKAIVTLVPGQKIEFYKGV